MRNPLSIAIVVAAAAAARAAEPAVAGRTPPPPARVNPEPLSANRIPAEPGPTAEAIAGLADDPSFEGHRRVYDGAGLVVGNSAYTLKNPIGPKVGKNDPPANLRVPDAGKGKVVPAAKEDDSNPFWDQPTIGFAALGVVVGGVIGIGLGLGLLGPLLGAVIVAALLVGLFKWKGYKKPE